MRTHFATLSLIVSVGFVDCDASRTEDTTRSPSYRGGKADNPWGVQPYFLDGATNNGLLPPVVDAEDRVYIAGDCMGSLVPKQTGCYARMLARLSTSGKLDWVLPLETSANTTRTQVLTLRLDPTGRAVIEGSFSGTLSANGKALLTAKGGAGFQLTVDGNGQIAEAVLTPAYPYAAPRKEASTWSTDGELYIASTADTGDAYVFGNRSKAVVQKLPSAARAGWTKVLSDDISWNGCTAVTTFSTGTVVFGCHAYGSLTLGGAAAGDKNGDSFLVSYDADGAFIAAHRFNGAVTGLAALSDGSIVATGTFKGTMDLGGTHFSDPSLSVHAFVTVLSSL